MHRVLWSIAQPDREYYDRLFIDGRLLYRFWLPGVKCDLCDDITSRYRLLPLACPSEWRAEITRLNEIGWLPYERFAEYKRRWEHEMQPYLQGITLRTGDQFQPAEWSVPSLPQFDVFWPSFSLICSNRLVDALTARKITGATFHSVTLVKVGASDATLPFPDSAVNDVSNLFGNLPYLEHLDECGKFYNTIATMHSAEQWHVEQRAAGHACARCDHVRAAVDRTERENEWREMQVVPRRYTYNSDIFQSHIYGWLLSERAFDTLSDVTRQNYNAMRVDVVDEPG